MKKYGYRVRVEDGSVIVEHRASFSRVVLGPLLLCYMCLMVLPEVRRALVEFYASPNASAAVSSLLFLVVPVVTGVSWLMFASGEVLYCDRKELRFARRRIWGRWHRFRFASSQVRKLHRAIRGSGKTRNYSVLTFEVQGRTYDMLEELSYTDSDRVLRACRSMGFDVVIDETADAMMKDIEKRGWWVNPFRTDDLGGPSDSSTK